MSGEGTCSQDPACHPQPSAPPHPRCCDPVTCEAGQLKASGLEATACGERRLCPHTVPWGMPCRTPASLAPCDLQTTCRASLLGLWAGLRLSRGEGLCLGAGLLVGDDWPFRGRGWPGGPPCSDLTGLSPRSQKHSDVEVGMKPQLPQFLPLTSPGLHAELSLWVGTTHKTSCDASPGHTGPRVPPRAHRAGLLTLTLGPAAS